MFFTKTENQFIENGKSANRDMNTKTEVFWHKNRKIDLKSSQNRKTQMPPSLPCQLVLFKKLPHQVLK